MPRSPVMSRKPRVKEISLHMTVAAYLRRAWPEGLVRPFHVPMGEQRDAKTGAKLKAMGAVAGVPDFVFVMPNGQVAFLELKAAGGTLSDEQVDFRDRALASNSGFSTARTPEEVEQIITRWLAAYGLKPRATMLRRAA